LTNSVVGNIPAGEAPFDIVYNPTNHNMYVTNRVSNTVSVIETTNSVIANIVAGDFPTEITYDPSNQHIYVINAHSDIVTMIHP
jgi:YVTN family beta-propeller protein